MNESVIAKVGVKRQLGSGKGDPPTRLGRRVEGCEGLICLKWVMVMVGSEAQVLDDEAYAANLLTSFP